LKSVSAEIGSESTVAIAERQVEIVEEEVGLQYA